MIDEIWLPIKDFSNYKINNLGEVKSLNRYAKAKGGMIRSVSERILKQGLCKKGYLRVNIYNEIGHNSIRVHRLVAEAFIPNPDNKPEVNHINGIKTDNKVSNLEWVTSKENMRHAVELGLIKEPEHELKLNIKEASLVKTMLTQNHSKAHIARMLNVSVTVITNIQKGKTWNQL